MLVGLSFAYGVFHAAGPGHGKAVISSYMLANEVALRRGVMLSFVSAFLQAFTAIVLMGLVFLALRGTAVSMTDAAWFLEVVSYAAITAFGAWLLWTKLRPRLAGWFGSAPAHSLSAAHAHSHAAMATRILTAMRHTDMATHIPKRMIIQAMRTRRRMLTASPTRMPDKAISRTAIMRMPISMIITAMHAHHAHAAVKSAKPAAIRMRLTLPCWVATGSTGKRRGRRWPQSAYAPAPVR